MQISEILHIQVQKNSINLQANIEFLHHGYISILNTWTQLGFSLFTFLHLILNN
jgi:hypothetical protein